MRVTRKNAIMFACLFAALLVIIPLYNFSLVPPNGACGDPDGYHTIHVAGTVEKQQSGWKFEGRVDISGNPQLDDPSAEDIEITFLDSKGDPIKNLGIDSIPTANNTTLVSTFTTELPRQPATIKLDAELPEDPPEGWQATYAMVQPSETSNGVIWYKPAGNCFDIPDNIGLFGIA